MRKILYIIVILGFLFLAWVGFHMCNAEPIETDGPKLELAKVYQSPMVVSEIRYQSKAPENTTSNTEKATSSAFTATITHYCACSKCNGKWSYTEDGINYTATAKGITLYDGISGNYCAATFGSLGDIITINGVDYKLVDRMGGNSGYRVDIFVSEGHDRCNDLGRFKAEVTLQ